MRAVQCAALSRGKEETVGRRTGEVGRPAPSALTCAERADLPLAEGRYAYVHVVRGEVTVNGTRLHDGDGARVRHERTLTFADGEIVKTFTVNITPDRKSF